MSLPTVTPLRALEWFKKSRLSSENLYHADLGSQNDGNSSRRELLWEMNNNNNTSPDILCGVRWLFLVKAHVSTSMKQQNYLVYCHLDQLSDEVAFSKCNCKPGQGGCCKHVTALGNCEEELPKKPVGWLSVNCRPTVGRLSADSRPTVGRLSADSWPTDGRQVLPEI